MFQVLPRHYFEYANNVGLYYMKEIFEYASQVRISSRNITLDLKLLFEKVTRARRVSHILLPPFGTNYQVQLKEKLV